MKLSFPAALSLPTLVCLAAASFVLPGRAGASEIDAWSQTSSTGMEIRVDVEGAPQQLFAIWSGTTMDADVDLATCVPIGHGYMNAVGRASLVFPAPTSMPDDFGVQLYVLMREPGGYSQSGIWLPLRGQGGTLCQNFDPNYTIGDDEPVAGERMDAQWSQVSMSVTGVGNAGAPDAVIAFDSGQPTGGDLDLVTPGPGINNSVALGNVLILPASLDDADGDGLVDVPNDSPAGGVMRFDFSEPYRMCSATVIDIDDSGLSELRFYIGDSMDLETIPPVNLGDNSVQTLSFDKRNVRRFELALAGSGALGRLQMVPCPLNVDLDETPFGAPRPDAAGEIVTDQYMDLGLSVSALNNVVGHPDALLLFDSENPTGEDFDLQTPGRGIGNDTPLGLVMIIAEDAQDIDGDGIVDDPDDEEGGGQMQFSFTEDVVFFSALVLDVDGVERDVFTFFDGNDEVLDILEIGALGENSVQMLSPAAPISGVRRIQVNLVGSGALARLRWCPVSNFQ